MTYGDESFDFGTLRRGIAPLVFLSTLFKVGILGVWLHTYEVLRKEITYPWLIVIVLTLKELIR